MAESEKKKGRNRKFDTAKLKEIVKEFFDKQTVFGQVPATEIAKYADEIMGYEGIRYYHFKRDKEVDDYIREINTTYIIGEGSSMHTEPIINPDKLLAAYGNDFTMLKKILWQFADRHRTMNDDIVGLKVEKHNNEKYIKELIDEKNGIKERLKERDAIIAKKNEEIKKLRRFKNFIDKANMLEYLKSHSLFNKLDEQNVNLILNSLGCTDELILDDDFDDDVEDLAEYEDEKEANINDENITTLKFNEIKDKVVKTSSNKPVTTNTNEYQKNVKSEVDKALEDMDSWL